MGYSYGQNERGRWVLSCDNCGNVGGVRKRTCPYKVLGDSLRTTTGQRYSMPYCYPAALCSACYATHKTTLHENCAAGAAESQAGYDAIEAGLDAGRKYVMSAVGDWHEDCPPGKTLVTFKGRDGEVTVAVDDYNPATKPWLDQYGTLAYVGNAFSTFKEIVF